MNAFWKDPHRRELLVAAAAGVVWALLGVAIEARGEDAFFVPSGSLPLVGRAGEGGESGTRVNTLPRRGEGNGGISSSSCRIRNHLGNGSSNIGSGTLIDVTPDRRAGLVLSCGHLFTEGVGRVIVEFADGRTHGARLLGIDRDADLSALEIASPAAAAAPIAQEIDGAEQLTACGFGPTGQFRSIAGPVVGAVEGPGQTSVKMAGAVRSGDSGGGVFDAQGRLVAVVWGESGAVTYASCGAPLRRFLERVRGRSASPSKLPSSNAATLAACPNGMCPVTAPRASTPACPNGLCPLVRPGSLGAAPAGRGPAASGGSITSPPAADGVCNCGCNAQIAAIVARIAAVESGKQDRGDYVAPSDLATFAHADQLAQFDQQNAERHQSLVDRLEKLAPLVNAAGGAAVPIATTALGISGPMGWGILAAMSIGGWLIGRQLRRRSEQRGSRRANGRKASAPLASNSSPLAPPPEATAAAEGAFRAARVRVETQQPVERDDREARELLRLSQLEGRDPLQDAVAGRIALDRLDAAADGDADPQHARWADDLRRELRERFNEIAPTKFQINDEFPNDE